MSVAAAMENMLLMAYDKGLAACILTAPAAFGPAERIRADFAPDKGKMLGIVVLGYSEQNPQAPRRREGRFTIV
jgi:nitroreductase